MKIRKYRSDDCPYCAALFHDSVHRVCANDYSPEQLATWATGCVDIGTWDQAFRAKYTLIAEEHGQIVGFANMDDAGYLDFLYVHADFQRRGVATALCNRLERYFAGKSFSTHASRTACPFFLRRGYRIVREQTVVRGGVTLTNYVMEKSALQLNERKQ